MKILTSIIPCIFFISCNNVPKVDVIVSPPENATTHAIQLADSLGTVTISLPSRYDTNFTWTHLSDCGDPCDKIKYRFQPKSLPIHKESGWMWFDSKDSIDRFTIIHSAYIYPFHNNPDSSYLRNLHLKNKQGLSSSPDTYKIKLDTIEKISNRLFSIFIIDLYDSVKYQYSKKILATTYINNNGVEFNFELLTKQRDSLNLHFLHNSLYFLRTIKINN